MTSRATANIVAVAIFVLTLVVGAFVLGTNHGVDHPETTTTVAKTAVPAASSSRSSTEIVRERGKRHRTITNTTKTTTPGTPESREVTSVRGGRSFVERVLGDSGVVFVQIGILLLAAYIAAAAVQRVLLGQFGGVKLGPFGLDELTRRTTGSVGKAITGL